MIENKLRTGPWNLSELKDIKPLGKKVFSCFSCGGGSTMGYKLSGYDVLGCCEIDPEMLEIYKANHNPRHPYLMGVQDFKNIPDKDLPKELFDLDVLDGSPPCSSFSMAGAREKKWGEESHFREGQAEQILDNLFFDFIDIAKKLQPKVVVAENVKGLIQGNARSYVKEIFKAFKDAGYEAQLFLLNASKMGVPQRRERTFFVANRIGKKIKFDFNEPTIPLSKAFEGTTKDGAKELTESTLNLWNQCKVGKQLSSVHEKGFRWNWIKLSPEKPSNTLASTDAYMHLHWDEPRSVSDQEILSIQSFPEDFNMLGKSTGYVCGMSVPPLMMQRVSTEIYKQLLT